MFNPQAKTRPTSGANIDHTLLFNRIIVTPLSMKEIEEND
jgi:hypothetical protein